MNHSFNIETAKEVGINAAVIFEHILFWCVHNAANGKNIHDGLAWTYNSRKAFTEIFPYLSEKQIRTALDKLEAAGLVKTGNYNKAGFDNTKWFAAVGPRWPTDLSERANALAPEGRPIPDINTDDKPDTKKNIKKKVDKPDCVSDEVWSEFLALRKAKRAPLTALALQGIEREAAKAGWTLEAALTESVERGWQAFKAEWVDKPQRGRQGSASIVDLVDSAIGGFE